MNSNYLSNPGQRHSEYGSALVETIVLMMVMLPLAFGIPMIGKLVDLKQTTVQAGRYAAWEATVYDQSHPHLSTAITLKERFYGKADNAIQSLSQEPGEHALWGDNNPEAMQPNSVPTSGLGLYAATAVEIDQNSVVADGIQSYDAPTLAMSIGQTIGRSGELLDGLKGNSWGLSTNGMVRVGVGVNVRSNEWLGADSSDCGSDDVFGCLDHSSVILVDGWSASGDDQASRRVRSLVPASALEPLGNIVSNVGVIPMFKELKGLDNAFGHVDMNALPEYAKP